MRDRINQMLPSWEELMKQTEYTAILQILQVFMELLDLRVLPLGVLWDLQHKELQECMGMIFLEAEQELKHTLHITDFIQMAQPMDSMFHLQQAME